MDVLGLLKFWRNLSLDASAGVRAGQRCSEVDAGYKTVEGELRDQGLEMEDEDSFFDLVFTAPDCYNKEENKTSAGVDSIKGYQFQKDETHDGSKRNDVQGSSNDVFSKRRIVPVEMNSKPQSPASLLKSPPKFRVFMLWLKKSTSEQTEIDAGEQSRQKSSQHEESKRFTMNHKAEEVHIASLFRDGSLRSKLDKENSEEATSEDSSKRFSRDSVQKYLKLIKPRYLKALNKHCEKTKPSDRFSQLTPMSSPASISACSPRKQVDEKQGSLPAGLRVVCKHLGKSRSASSSVRIMPSPASRRDDSLIMQHDGIQSAILHCKRSYNSSEVFSTFSRSASHPVYEKPMGSPRSSI